MEIFIEAVVPRWSVEKVFLEISQNSQENTYATVSFLINLQIILVLNYVFLVSIVKKHFP